jgi:uncharacterized protein
MISRPRVAVVGSGISGLVAAERLSTLADVTLFEADRRCGGHAHTVDLTLHGQTFGVDTGFLVFNTRTYPGLIALFERLGVPTAPSDMSFSVQLPADNLEWSGSSLGTVFGQRRNLLRPRFLHMLTELLRFNRLATELVHQPDGSAVLNETAGNFLDRHRFSPAFRNWYLLPMVACIWSCPAEQMLRFPMATLVRFCHNHGLLQVNDRPPWMTVHGGSRIYVHRLLKRIGALRTGTPVLGVRRVPPSSGTAGVWLRTEHGAERFDDVVLACHTDQALALLEDASPRERALLGAIRYQRSRAVLHTDTALLPRRRRVWAAWNCERATDARHEREGVCLHYLINRLQPLPTDQPVIVSMNPLRAPAPPSVHGEFEYSHPVFDVAAIDAQQRLPAIQGVSHVWFCGAWTRYGFHEDGLQSGAAVAEALAERFVEARAQGREQGQAA